MSRFQAVQNSCSNSLKQLESRRNKTQTKIRRLKRLRCGSAVFLVALTATLAVIVVTHAFVILVAAPGVMVTSLELVSIEKLARRSAQLDSAAKGAYILIRDLDTISRLAARLNNELERVDALMQLWLERGDDRLHANEEVASQLKRNNQSFIQQLDELEEHLYLCFMTNNRARNIVTKEILNSGNSTLNSSNSTNYEITVEDASVEVEIPVPNTDEVNTEAQTQATETQETSESEDDQDLDLINYSLARDRQKAHPSSYCM
ncbi:hypothetical protein ACS0TY_004547 [Phlomoides rotata]